MFEINSAISIDAPTDLVWAILADFDAYRRWNPFLRSIHGEPRRGATIAVTMEPRGLSATVFSPRILNLREPQEIRWAGPVTRLGLLHCETRLSLHAVEGGWVQFRHMQRYSGLLAGVMRPRIEAVTARGFRDMNLALRDRAERAGQKMRADPLAA